MKLSMCLTVLVLLMVLAGPHCPDAADRESVQALNGLSFRDIRGYESWQVVAPSYRTDKNEIRFILGNEALMRAYLKGVPENGKPFPDGSILVKVAHAERKSPDFPAAIEPGALQRIEFMVKDSKRFADTGGWGYARFVYDQKSDTFTAYGKDPDFARECYICHTIVQKRDFVFTRYAPR